MGSFLNSDMVIKSLMEIDKLQNEIYGALATPQLLSKQEKHEQLDKLEVLLEKQRIMHTRITLSDDPDAKRMKDDFEETKIMMGIPSELTAEDVFLNTEKMIERLRKNIDLGS